MTYLFQLATRYRDVQVTYNISQVQFDEYFAESTNAEIQSFFLRRKSGAWICEGGFEEFQAEKVGRLIDDLYVSIMQN
jgi:DNA polymerase elongation subunit (family B)